MVDGDEDDGRLAARGTSQRQGSDELLGGVLLVEDDPRDLELMVRVFRSHTRRPIEVVSTPGDATDRLDAPLASTAVVPSPVLVMLDLGLPGGSGFDVLQRLRADDARAHIPVVVLTRSREDAVLRASYALRASSVLIKPDDPHELEALLARTAVYWLDLNILPKPPAPQRRPA